MQYFWRQIDGHPVSNKQSNNKIWYYYIADCIAKGDLSVVWCPTNKMIADFLTKPLQGKVLQQFRDVLMGAVPMWYDID